MIANVNQVLLVLDVRVISMNASLTPAQLQAQQTVFNFLIIISASASLAGMEGTVKQE